MLVFSRLKCVTINTSIILYVRVVSDSRCLNITCLSGSRVQVIAVVPEVTVARFTKQLLMCIISFNEHVSEK
jgi:hypothetical protein